MAEGKFEKKVMIKEIIDFFELVQVTGNEQSLNRWVVVPDANRPGFELCGYLIPTTPRRVVIVGNKELEYISTLTEAQQRERFKFIMDGFTPMIVMTHFNEVPKLMKEIAQELNFPIFKTHLNTSRFMVDLITYLDERLAPEMTLSGDLLKINGIGVMLIGESGMGKSETALDLLCNKQILIADDRVDIQKIHNTIVGYAPELLVGMLEIRGIGIIDVERMFGANAVAKKSRLDLIIRLVKFDPLHEYERVGENYTNSTDLMGVKIPTMEIPVSSGRSTRVLVETAVSNFVLKTDGYNSTQQFKDRLLQILVKKAEDEKND